MKTTPPRLWAALLLLTLLLSGCSGEGVYQVTRQGIAFQIDPQAHTVAWEDWTASYATGSDSLSDWVELTYPDGSTFRRFWRDGARSHTASGDYDPARYLPGETLLEALSREVPTGEMEPRLVGAAAGLFLLTLGGFFLLCPDQALLQRTRGASLEGRDSPLARRLTRALGAVGAVLGGAVLVWSLVFLQ